MRALASIKAELQKRQRLFGEYDVNHINQYQKLYKQGKAKEAMPHLFLISDEFAELKSEQPEFMKELVSTARIGRSLGIHLILATQKPSGVVDDQIWSNSKFKLALKVQNASDSSEILKTPDAADITLPGRAYLQVGNNEIYELFQSAWSGADYIPDKEDNSYMDTTVYAINDLGQYDILTEDLSGLDKKEDLTKLPSELDAVIAHIHEYTKAEGIEVLPRPWLPPLADRVYLTELEDVDYEVEWQKEKSSLQATVGIADQPELQSQSPLVLDLNKDGHVAIFSSPGYGKSTFLQSLVMGMVRKHNPEHLHLYLLDFGTNGLLPLKDLPHVADTILIDEKEKCLKFVSRISKTIKERKKNLSNYGVANIEMFEKASKKTLPNILITIDNFDSIKESGLEESLLPLITQIGREGVSVGVFLAISANRQNALNMQLAASIKTQIALYLIETGEVSSIVGRTSLKIEDLPGRGLIKVEDPTLFQVALPNKSEEVLETIANIQEEATEMASRWRGSIPKSIPMVPDELSYTNFAEWDGFDELDNGILPVGIEMERVELIGLDFKVKENLLIAATNQEEIQNIIHVLANSMISSKAWDIGIVDTKKRVLSYLRGDSALYVNTAETIEKTIMQFKGIFEKRESAFKEAQKENIEISSENFCKQFKPIMIVFADIYEISDQLSEEAISTLIDMINNAAFMGIHFVIGSIFEKLEYSYDKLSKVLKTLSTVLLFRKTYGQSLFEVTNPDTYQSVMHEQEAYLISNRLATKIKVPKK